MKWFLIAFTVCLSSCGDILCAQGMSQGSEVEVENPQELSHTLRYIVTRRMVILGWLCYALSFFSLVALLSVAKMTVAIPATAFSFVIDTIGARFILHEHVPWRRWVGVVCVTAGVLLVVSPASSRATKPLSRTARAGCIPMESRQNQANHHQRGPNELDPQRPPCEVLAKP